MRIETNTKIVPCLWFDDQAEDAAKLYVSLFPNSSIDHVSRYEKAGFEIHGKPAGSAMTVDFRLAGQPMMGLNGGPQFKFTEAISLQIMCGSQEEVDHYWYKLSEGGSEGPCGWLKDPYGLSWQVVPTRLNQLIREGDAAQRGRVTNAFLKMKKFDIAALERAFAGS
jgi:predicted 3-demethylubiquinone-9 3-methyltransferase (glyoxalase superfamily)